MSRLPLLGATAAAITLLSGCGTIDPETGRLVRVFAPYRIDVVQGNVVTSEQLEKVKPGMSRNQVRDVLGSPMLADLFHADRWDYVFTIRRQGTAEQRRSVVAYFKDDKLDRLEAADLPSEREFVASIFRTDTSSRPIPLKPAMRPSCAVLALSSRA